MCICLCEGNLSSRLPLAACKTPKMMPKGMADHVPFLYVHKLLSCMFDPNKLVVMVAWHSPTMFNSKLSSVCFVLAVCHGDRRGSHPRNRLWTITGRASTMPNINDHRAAQHCVSASSALRLAKVSLLSCENRLVAEGLAELQQHMQGQRQTRQLCKPRGVYLSLSYGTRSNKSIPQQ